MNPYRVAPPPPATPRRGLAERARDLWRHWQARREADDALARWPERVAELRALVAELNANAARIRAHLRRIEASGGVGCAARTGAAGVR